MGSPSGGWDTKSQGTGQFRPGYAASQHPDGSGCNPAMPDLPSQPIGRESSRSGSPEPLGRLESPGRHILHLPGRPRLIWDSPSRAARHPWATSPGEVHSVRHEMNLPQRQASPGWAWNLTPGRNPSQGLTASCHKCWLPGPTW